MILVLDRAEEASSHCLQLICSEVIYRSVDLRDSNCGADYLYKRSHGFEYCVFQPLIPLPVGAINVKIVLGSSNNLIDLKPNSHCWLHEKARAYLKKRRRIE